MTIRATYDLCCTNCQKQFVAANESGWENEYEIGPLASTYGWQCGVLVLNGSFWDFCPRCWKNHKTEAAK